MRHVVPSLFVFLMLCTPALAAEDIQTLEKELQALENELPEILKAETGLEARQDYVNQVLALREKIEALEGEDAGGETAPKKYEHVFKLVRIESLEELGESTLGDSSWRKTFNENNTTYTHIVDSTKKKNHAKWLDSRSLGFDEYPQEIVLGQFFSFRASAVRQRDLTPGPCKSGKQNLPLSINVSVSGLHEYLHDGVKKSTPYEVSDCKEGRSAQAIGVGARVEALVECHPGRGEFFDIGAVRYEYECKISATDGEAVWDRGKEKITFALSVKTDGNTSKPVKDKDGYYILDPPGERFYPVVQEDFDISLGLGMSSLDVRLFYEPVYSTTDQLEGTGMVQHVAINNYAGEGGEESEAEEGAVETAGKDDGKAGDRDESQSESDEQESATLQAAREKEERNGHIQGWLANAQPVENAQPGYNLIYDKWGRVQGQAPNGTITLAKPDSGGLSPADYAWVRADMIDSLNLCTLKEYVERKLANEETASCRKDIAPQQADSGTVPDFVGLQAAKAKTDLEKLGMKVKWRPGAIAKDTRQQGLIEKQKPAPGTNLKNVKEVELWAYRYATKTVTVPDVRGLPFAQAMEKLRHEGLEASLGSSVPLENTRDGAKPGTVFSQTITPGERVANGAVIAVHVYGSAGKVSVPQVVGLTYGDALAAMRKAGLEVQRRSGSYAPSRARANTVQSTDPAPGSKIDLGTEVELIVYDMYSDEVQTAKTPQKTRPDAPSARALPQCTIGQTVSRSGTYCVDIEPSYQPQQPVYAPGDVSPPDQDQGSPNFVGDMLDLVEEIAEENARRRQQNAPRRPSGPGYDGIFSGGNSGGSPSTPSGGATSNDTGYQDDRRPAGFDPDYGTGSAGSNTGITTNRSREQMRDNRPSGGLGSGALGCIWQGGYDMLGIPGVEVPVVCECDGKIVDDSRCPGPKPEGSYYNQQ